MTPRHQPELNVKVQDAIQMVEAGTLAEGTVLKYAGMPDLLRHYPDAAFARPGTAVVHRVYRGGAVPPYVTILVNGAAPLSTAGGVAVVGLQDDAASRAAWAHYDA